MALRRSSLPIIFALILFSSQVLLARELGEKPASEEKNAKKDANVKADDAKFNVHGYGSGKAEFIVPDDAEVDGFGDEKHSFGYGPGYGYGGYGGGYGSGYGYGRGYRYGPGYGGGYGSGWRRCRYSCGYGCCSAKEYAEFVQAGN
ncbi:uncharacterized protein LOC116246688 [Nymphaea colorata]|uniref:uncharacterized protein LOC116246688 n=1 Tax=Nymphaea colorata TaxID=210225 RepID=UPI00129E6C24|nr:uncharacterized protein LOC116246688 [Nymphaea colorata]